MAGADNFDDPDPRMVAGLAIQVVRELHAAKANTLEGLTALLVALRHVTAQIESDHGARMTEEAVTRANALAIQHFILIEVPNDDEPEPDVSDPNVN